jgi:hypothetical protein
VKTIDRFDREDDETSVTVTLTTVGPTIIGLETRNRELGDRQRILLTPDEARRVGQALLKAHADATSDEA